MQYMLLIYDNEKLWTDMPEAERTKLFGEYMQFTTDIKASGHHIAGDALQPVHTATTVRVRNGKTTTTDGPFAETREQLGGYYLINAKDLDEADADRRAHPELADRIDRDPSGDDFLNK